MLGAERAIAGVHEERAHIRRHVGRRHHQCARCRWLKVITVVVVVVASSFVYTLEHFDAFRLTVKNRIESCSIRQVLSACLYKFRLVVHSNKYSHKCRVTHFGDPLACIESVRTPRAHAYFVRHDQ